MTNNSTSLLKQEDNIRSINKLFVVSVCLLLASFVSLISCLVRYEIKQPPVLCGHFVKACNNYAVHYRAAKAHAESCRIQYNTCAVNPIEDNGDGGVVGDKEKKANLSKASRSVAHLQTSAAALTAEAKQINNRSRLRVLFGILFPFV